MKQGIVLILLVSLSIVHGQTWCDFTTDEFKLRHEMKLDAFSLDPLNILWEQTVTYMVNLNPPETSYVPMTATKYWQQNTWNQATCCFESVQAWPRGEGVWALTKIQECPVRPQELLPAVGGGPPRVARAIYDTSFVTQPLYDQRGIPMLTVEHYTIADDSTMVAYLIPDTGFAVFTNLVNIRSNNQLLYTSQNLFLMEDALPMWSYTASRATTEVPADVAAAFAAFNAGELPLLDDPLGTLYEDSYPVPLYVHQNGGMARASHHHSGNTPTLDQQYLIPLEFARRIREAEQKE